MTSEWEDSTLGDVLTLQRGMDLPVQERKGGKHPIVASTGVVGFHNEAPVKAPGVVIGRSGSIGGGQFVAQDFWPLNTTLWVKDFKGNDPRYCYYLLKSIDFSSMNAGSGVPTLNRNHLHPMRVAKPPVSVQKSISGMLGSLDDRIALLRETNQTLEAIAQALFKSWFVDFDPVRAKVEGKLPEGIDAATAALFPDGFEETELGLVPKGWKISTVEEISERVGMGPFGSNIKVETFVESGIPVISGQHLKQLLVEDNTFNFITLEHAQRLSKSCVQAGDVIFTHAGSIGQVSLLHADSEYNKYVLSQRQFFLRCNSSLISPEWIVYYFKSAAGQHQLLANTSQVGVPSIARPVSYLKSIRLIVPSSQINQKFAAIVAPTHNLIISNRKHISTLTALRDTLLPRLISGQLHIADAEVELEKAIA
ncbi:restriction endonuclease subunit S [Polynucleobacter sp. MWH-Spelu-300-X4]|uniref:restriction endonuclease subunit S n=1 Tax=Polynucleobacter sp. MWH-Spelu-300-X4 TaxID=2689109 RepID=UPI001BFEDE2C|nr:restriction endonuclease subunit S [Polynucleobacter sp. MWH-Spelu-300-X4]QWD79439.1 restriction endonuclease subunit S [Polynucleobacter sp. MWH-Spelu-300-X4]